MTPQIFGHFTDSRPCLLCGVPMIVDYDLPLNTWTLVHGEVPVVCWKDETIDDLWPGWNDKDFQRDVALALDSAHWEAAPSYTDPETCVCSQPLTAAIHHADYRELVEA